MMKKKSELEDESNERDKKEKRIMKALSVWKNEILESVGEQRN